MIICQENLFAHSPNFVSPNKPAIQYQWMTILLKDLWFYFLHLFLLLLLLHLLLLLLLFILNVAGYSVITYILSVGDRHLDNLLLTEQGNLIHIDFGYMLGRDPKLFPPPMRLSKEMVSSCCVYARSAFSFLSYCIWSLNHSLTHSLQVDAMGGTSSKEFTKFREPCYNAFLALRWYKPPY